MTTDLILILFFGVIATLIIRATYHHEFIVNDGFAGLLYHHGTLAEILVAGRHIRWGTGFRLASVDTRKTLLQVAGQEVLTSDNIGVKLSVVLTIQLVDAAKTVQAVDNHIGHIYSAAQTAIRAAVAGATMEALLTQRVAIGTQVRELIAAGAEAIGVRVHSVEVRDVMLPGELRKAFSEVLKAKQDGQAALERARGESAALRNLANAARLIESQPALITLRFLQTLEASAPGKTWVMNDLATLLPTLGHRSTKPAAPDPGEAG